MNDEIKLIASRIKEMREILEISPEDLASKIGVSTEEYIAYENAEKEITINKIYSIAKQLNLDPTVILLGESPRMLHYSITRAGKGVNVERYKEYKFSSLAYNFQNRDMEPLLVELLPKDTPPELVVHGGQEFNYVLKGKVGVLYGNHVFELAAGDSIYFDPSIPHGQIAIDGPAEFITIING